MAFFYFRTCLNEAPILKYPDPQKRYVVFTDASDQAAAAVLTQEYPDADGEVKEMPIPYLSAQFSDSQFKSRTVVKEVYAICYAIKKWRHYLEYTEILLKIDATSLQKFFNGRRGNVKLDRWSLELQGRNIQVEHIPGHKNKAVDSSSRLPFAIRKRNNNPLNDADVSINETQIEENSDCCPLCEVEVTDAKTLQQPDKHIRITKLRVDFMKGFLWLLMTLVYCVTSVERMAKNTKPQLSPRSVSKLLCEMHDHFGHFDTGKTYSLRDITTGLR